MSCKIQISYKLLVGGYANVSYMAAGVLRTADSYASLAKLRLSLAIRYMEKS
jgi:hypothetical protein